MGCLFILEDSVSVFNDELNGKVLVVHISHFTLDAEIPHNGWSKHDGQVLGRHLIRRLEQS